MRLLFDENLPPRLVALLAADFPGSAHVRNCGLLGGTDEAVWAYARQQGLTIVSKDADFQQRSLLYGQPPKVIWLRIGNCSIPQVVHLLVSHRDEILALLNDPDSSLLVLS